MKTPTEANRVSEELSPADVLALVSLAAGPTAGPGLDLDSNTTQWAAYKEAA